MRKPQPRRPAEPSWLEVAGKAHVHAALAAVRQANILALDNPDPFADAALQELLRRVFKNLADWHVRNAAWIVELALRGGLEPADLALRDLISEKNERREPFNSALTTYANIILADRGGVITYRRPRSRPRESPLVAFVIILLITDVMNEFPQLHLDRSSSRHPSAFSLVAAVLIEARLFHGGEKAIRAIWKQYKPPLLAPVGRREDRFHRALLLKSGS
jgi:hypothetical protein